MTEVAQLVLSLPCFDGPFDLLLALIRRNEYEIDALPVAEITQQFLAYVQSARDLEADLAGEFVEVASWLVLLKSRSLLPARDLTEISPGEELRRAVLDQQTLRAARKFLREREAGARPGSAGAPPGSDEEMELSGPEGPTVQDLLEAARQALEAARAAAALESTQDVSVSVEEQIGWIGRQLEAGATQSTEPWFTAQPSPGARAALLLALLELARGEFLLLHQSEEFAPLLVKPLGVVAKDEGA